MITVWPSTTRDVLLHVVHVHGGAVDLGQLGGDLRDELVLLDELGQVGVHAWVHAHLEPLGHGDVARCEPDLVRTWYDAPAGE